MNSLKIGISGVRGLVGETFTPELAVGFAQAFGTYLDSGRILVCRDARTSGPMVRSAVLAGLLASGCEVIDLGVCPTPSLQLAVKLARRRRRNLHNRGPQPRALERAQVRTRRRALLERLAGRRASGHLSSGRVREGRLGADTQQRRRARRDNAPPRSARARLRR